MSGIEPRTTCSRIGVRGFFFDVARSNAKGKVKEAFPDNPEALRFRGLSVRQR